MRSVQSSHHDLFHLTNNHHRDFDPQFSILTKDFKKTWTRGLCLNMDLYSILFLAAVLVFVIGIQYYASREDPLKRRIREKKQQELTAHFPQLTAAEIDELVSGSVLRRFKAGAPVMTAGQQIFRVFVVRAGSLEMTKEGKQPRIISTGATIGKDMFRTSTAKATIIVCIDVV